MLKIATWNVNSIRVRLVQVLDWLQAEGPDFLAIQETKTVDEMFPGEEFRQLGYQPLCNGQKTYNGVAVIGRTEPDEILAQIPEFPDPQKRFLYARYGDLAILNLYVPNGMAVGSVKYAYKLDWLAHVHTFVRQYIDKTRLLAVVGDFNIAPADADVYNPAEWRGKVLASEPERERFFQLIDAGLVDCYRRANEEAAGFTWWDYRAAGFARNRGLRIDHILANTGLAGHCIACRVDTAPRALERPSDHAPLVAEFDL